MPDLYDSPNLSEAEHAALDHGGVPGVPEVPEGITLTGGAEPRSIAVEPEVGQTEPLLIFTDSAGRTVIVGLLGGRLTLSFKSAAAAFPYVALNGNALFFGDGTVDPTANLASLYGAADDVLITDGKLVASAGLGVGNSAAATTPGTVTKKMEVFDASGVSLGFVPIYNAIT